MGFKNILGKLGVSKLQEKIVKKQAKVFYSGVKKAYRNDKDIREACEKMLEAIDKEDEDEIQRQGIMIQGYISSKGGKK